METLKTFASKWSAALRAGDTGLLVIAQEVVRVADEWESRWQADSKDLSCNDWLRDSLGPGKGLGFWRARAEAVEKLGESIRRTLHHEVAIRVVNTAPPEFWERLVSELTKGRRNGVAMTPAQATRIFKAVLGKGAVKKVRQCPRCLELEAQIAELRVAARREDAAAE